MKINKIQQKTLVTALYLAKEWELSSIDSWDSARDGFGRLTPDAKDSIQKSQKNIKKFNKLRSKILLEIKKSEHENSKNIS